MRVSEATFLRLKRFHLDLDEASKAKLFVGAALHLFAVPSSAGFAAPLVLTAWVVISVLGQCLD